MNFVSSLRRLNGIAMASSVTLVFGMAVLGVTSLRTVTRQTLQDITALQSGSSLARRLRH